MNMKQRILTKMELRFRVTRSVKWVAFRDLSRALIQNFQRAPEYRTPLAVGAPQTSHLVQFQMPLSLRGSGEI